MKLEHKLLGLDQQLFLVPVHDRQKSMTVNSPIAELYDFSNKSARKSNTEVKGHLKGSTCFSPHQPDHLF